MLCIDNEANTIIGYSYKWVKELGKCVLTHRLVYCRHNKVSLESIKGLVVRHTCDNRSCINPEHLLIGTVADNNRDKVNRGRCAKSRKTRKLSDDVVKAIRSRYIKGCSVNGCTGIAKELGMHQSTINDIVNHKIYIEYID